MVCKGAAASIVRRRGHRRPWGPILAWVDWEIKWFGQGWLDMDSFLSSTGPFLKKSSHGCPANSLRRERLGMCEEHPSFCSDEAESAPSSLAFPSDEDHLLGDNLEMAVEIRPSGGEWVNSVMSTFVLGTKRSLVHRPQICFLFIWLLALKDKFWYLAQPSTT